MLNADPVIAWAMATFAAAEHYAFVARITGRPIAARDLGQCAAILALRLNAYRLDDREDPGSLAWTTGSVAGYLNGARRPGWL